VKSQKNIQRIYKELQKKYYVNSMQFIVEHENYMSEQYGKFARQKTQSRR